MVKCELDLFSPFRLKLKRRIVYDFKFRGQDRKYFNRKGNVWELNLPKRKRITSNCFFIAVCALQYGGEHRLLLNLLVDIEISLW